MAYGASSQLAEGGKKEGKEGQEEGERKGEKEGARMWRKRSKEENVCGPHQSLL